MPVIYDDLVIPYDYGLITLDGDAGAGSVTGGFAETSTMAGAVDKSAAMAGAVDKSAVMAGTITH